jgi:hypothetical protein
VRHLHILCEGQTEEMIASDVESGPELVNDGVDTAPSKRILNAYPQYAKTIHGPLVIAEAGLDAIRSTCPHTDDWPPKRPCSDSIPATATKLKWTWCWSTPMAP